MDTEDEDEESDVVDDLGDHDDDPDMEHVRLDRQRSTETNKKSKAKSKSTTTTRTTRETKRIAFLNDDESSEGEMGNHADEAEDGDVDDDIDDDMDDDQVNHHRNNKNHKRKSADRDWQSQMPGRRAVGRVWDC